ncbi:hypothetical protein PROFUN_15239 [Planoprotostelium fungivorum]|uniref:Uncharacterized protein n=1 Tax=Planoprotostelium fungivorum TaxID=1890364 RepID=A0A2P6MXF6_9EUKA|nr:hypothetical protein PROFUN_15239 [Planoprotostelium fungivorum]
MFGQTSTKSFATQSNVVRLRLNTLEDHLVTRPLHELLQELFIRRHPNQCPLTPEKSPLQTLCLIQRDGNLLDHPEGAHLTLQQSGRAENPTLNCPAACHGFRGLLPRPCRPHLLSKTSLSTLSWGFDQFQLSPKSPRLYLLSLSKIRFKSTIWGAGIIPSTTPVDVLPRFLTESRARRPLKESLSKHERKVTASTSKPEPLPNKCSNEQLQSHLTRLDNHFYYSFNNAQAVSIYLPQLKAFFAKGLGFRRIVRRLWLFVD